MTRLGLPVPAGFIITTESSLEYMDNGSTMTETLENEIIRAVHDLERRSGKVFGPLDDSVPLLLSVRSAPAVNLRQDRTVCPPATPNVRFSVPESWSVPGVQGTVLNIGLNESNCKNLASHFGLQFALDTYARHLMSFGTIVLGATPNEYNSILDSRRADNRYGYTLTDLEHIVEQFKRVRAVPEDPWEQVSEHSIHIIRMTIIKFILYLLATSSSRINI